MNIDLNNKIKSKISKTKVLTESVQNLDSEHSTLTNRLNELKKQSALNKRLMKESADNLKMTDKDHEVKMKQNMHIIEIENDDFTR